VGSVTKQFEGEALTVSGRFFRTASVRDEPYQCLREPANYIAKLKEGGFSADLFSFLQPIADTTPRFDFHREAESLAVIPVSTYEQWWKKQVNDKTRNMVRKGQKAGVDYRLSGLTDELVQGVVQIYNETPLRQGKPFKHYGKSFETIKADLSTFPEQSSFLGAYFKGELIGFIKLVRGENVFSFMHILSMIAHRDKAPTNGLIAKAVEISAEQKIGLIHYSLWSRRGLGDFKKHHGFVQYDVPRYFVPLNGKGSLMLKCKLHRELQDRIPERWIDDLVRLRARWNAFRAGAKT